MSNKLFLTRLSRRRLAAVLLGLALTAAACGAPASPEAPVEASVTDTAVPVEAQPTTAPTAQADTPAEPTATQAVAQTENGSVEAPVAPVECQAVEVPDNTLIAAASAADWAKGPEDAPVTLIEYGDFQ